MMIKKFVLVIFKPVQRFCAHMIRVKYITSKKGLLTIAITLCILLTFTGVSFYGISGWERERLSSDFESHANHLANAIQTEFSGHVEVLHSIESLYQSSQDVTQGEFHTFVMPHLTRHPGIQVLAWVPRVPDTEREMFEETARLEGYTEFQIIEYQNQQRIPAEQRDEYFPMYYIESYEVVDIVPGFDIASDSDLLASLNQARDIGEAVATASIDLTGSGDQQYAVYVYVPIYYGDSSTSTVMGRREVLAGYASGVFGVGDVVNAIMGTGLYDALGVEVYGETGRAGEQLLYTSHQNSEYADSDTMAQTVTFEMAKRQWALRIIPTQNYLTQSSTRYSWAVLIGGLILTLVIGQFLLIRLKNTLSIEKLAGELAISNRELQEEISIRRNTEAELRTSEEKYSQLVEQGNDGIILIQDNVLLFANSKMREMTGLSEEEYIRRPFLDFVTPEYKGLLLERYKARMSGEEVSNRYEAEIIDKDGKKIPVEVNASIIDYEGKPADMAIIRDISGRKRAQEALADEATRRRILIEESSDGIVILDENGYVFEANKRFAEMHGYTPEEAQKLHILDWGPQVPQERIRQMLMEVDETGDHFETQHRRKDGTALDMEISTNGAVIGDQKLIFCVCRDITGRKRAEEALADEAVRRRILIEESRDGIVVLDENGRVYESNKRFAQMLGYTTEEIKDVCVWDWEYLLPHEQVLEMIRSVDSAGDHFETKHRRKDGSVYDVEISTNGEMFGGQKLIFCVCRDITERKRAEEEIRVFSDAVAGAIDAISISDKDGIISYVNSSLEEIYGYEPGELVGKQIDVLNANEETTRRLITSINEKGSWSGEIEAKRKSGEVFPAFLTISTVRDDEGHFIAMLGTSRDISEQKKIEEEKEETAQKAYLSSRLAAVGQMAAGIAHEINNPLTGVIGFADLLMSRTDIPDDIRKDIEIINDGAQRVGKIVKGMLTFARNSKTEREYADINEILKTTLTLRDYEMTTTDIKVETHLGSDLPMTMAAGGQLQQVFLNIIINAEQAIKKTHGRGNLIIKTEGTKDVIRVSFQDDGPGIDRENIDRIFEPFFTTKQPGEGTGLGLSLCYAIIQEHNGQIYVKSTKGKGATFIVELPIIGPNNNPGLPEVAEEEEEEEVQKNKILIIDDEVVVRHFLKRMLTDAGHVVETVDNASDGLERISEEQYDLILLDIKMPDISGIEVYQRVRELDEAIAKKIIFITGDVMADETKAFFSKTNVTYISKPFDNNILKKEIARQLTEDSKVPA